MAGFCLPKAAVDSFTNALRSGKIDPYKLNQMTSEERRGVFEGIVGKEGAAQVNAEFEAKTLLKNQKYAYTAWAKKVAGITPDTRRDLMARISKMDHILNPGEEKQFLSDLAAKKLGVGVTQEEAKNIAELSGKIQATEAKGLSTTEQATKKGFTPSANDLEHAYARYDLQKYISDLKKGDTGFRASDLKTGKGPVQGIAKLPREVANLSKSIGASLDDSFALRQGSKAFLTHPTFWGEEFKNSFVNIAKGAKNADAARREFKAHLMADPLYDQAVKDGLAIIKHEDVFPTSLPGKIPIAGRAFNASEVAYEAYAENLRLGLYKNELRLAEGKGKDIAEGNFSKNIATMVNSLTGRGSLGRLEPVSGPINVAFYSLRFLKSNIDTLISHPLGSGVGGTADLIRGKTGAQAVSYAQKRAAQNLVKIIAGTAAILETANKLKPGSVDFDPRSANFGKIKVGDTRFEVTGGLDSIITLAAQQLTSSSKSTTTRKVSKFSPNFGSETRLDNVVKFLGNKASPAGGVAYDYYQMKDHTGKPFSLKNEGARLVTPLNVSNFAELKGDKNSANILAAVIADTLGVSTNTYGKSTTNWSTNPTKELSTFQQKVGADKFKQANTDYNNKLDSYMQNLTSNPTYKALPDSQKQAVLTGAKAKIKAQVFKDYGFKYNRPATDKNAAQVKKSLLNTIH